MAVSRTAKSIKNSTISLTYYLVNLMVQFFSRKVFLEYLGTEILGLNSTATNLLQFLNLAELGISTAVGFCLYKPIYDEDYDAINEIVTLQGIIYKRVAYIILAGAGILMCFFPLIFAKMELPLWYAYASFGVLLYSALLGYFVNYKQIILSASQQDYKVLYSFKTVSIIKSLVQMFAVWYFTNGYIAWLILEVVFSTIGAVCLHYTTIKTFPCLKAKITDSFSNLRCKYPELTKRIGQLFFHKIGGFALSQTSPLIIYAYANMTLVALYGNYLIITQGVALLSQSVFNSINAGIGNLIAEGNKEKIRRLFDELFSLRFFIVSVICMSVYSLTPDFIRRWIGERYLLSNLTLTLMVIMLYIQLFRVAVDSFIYAYGLFGDIYAPIIEAVLNIGLSILGGYYYGINGILAGAIISQIIIVVIWRPYYLFTRKMIGYGKHYVYLYLKHLCIFALSAGIYFYITSYFPSKTALSWSDFICWSILKILLFTILILTALTLCKAPITQTYTRFKRFLK